MAFSQLSMKLCHTVDIILPKAIGGTSKIMKSKVGRIPGPHKNSFWCFKNEAVLLGKTAIDF